MKTTRLIGVAEFMVAITIALYTVFGIGMIGWITYLGLKWIIDEVGIYTIIEITDPVVVAMAMILFGSSVMLIGFIFLVGKVINKTSDMFIELTWEQRA